MEAGIDERIVSRLEDRGWTVVGCADTEPRELPPTKERVTCVVCRKPIRRGATYRGTIWRTTPSEAVHETCFTQYRSVFERIALDYLQNDVFNRTEKLRKAKRDHAYAVARLSRVRKFFHLEKVAVPAVEGGDVAVEYLDPARAAAAEG